MPFLWNGCAVSSEYAYITPFVGKQVAISEAFDFDIPEGCAPEYVVRKTNKGKRGRPRKNKQVVKEESET